MISLFIASILILAKTTFSAIVILRQQRTIDTLTSKLMARDYKEYMTMQPKQEPSEQPKKRKPLSWYDDVSEDEETVN